MDSLYARKKGDTLYIKDPFSFQIRVIKYNMQKGWETVIQTRVNRYHANVSFNVGGSDTVAFHRVLGTPRVCARGDRCTLCRLCAL